MKKYKHVFKFVESSQVTIPITGEIYNIDKFICPICKGLYFLDKKTGKRVKLNGGIGKEVE